jgi:deaminated glutathione amidase
MVFLPEACDYIESSSEASKAKSETLDGRFITSLKELASNSNIWISVGSFHRKLVVENEQENKMFNSHVILDNKGEIKCVNDKIHLFEVNIKNETENKLLRLKESDFTTPGRSFHLPLQTPVGLVGTCIVWFLQ